jgi:aminopeptidase N
MSPAEDALSEIRRLVAHEAYDPLNPNKVRAVLGAFARDNLVGFHRPDGAAQSFFADAVLAIDGRNPQLAARLTTILENWRKFEPMRRQRLKAALERLAGAPGISTNLAEIAGRLLKDESGVIRG